MGIIKADVEQNHLVLHPKERDWLKPFLDGFSITWAKRRRAYNTELSVYFLQPEPFMTELFGFHEEILLAYSNYPALEPRAIQALESFLADDPAKGRVEKLTAFLVAEAPDVHTWVADYGATNQEARLLAGFSAEALRSSGGDSWHVRNVIGQQLWTRNLFDYRLPLEKDLFFFGRTGIVARYLDSIKRSENKGLFGLRKTGKTSILFKLERNLADDPNYLLIYLDCKLTSIRRLRWFELIEKICREIAKRFALPFSGPLSEITAPDSLQDLLARLPESKRVAVIFDEIEWVSPLALEDLHWHKDFIAFWQCFWSCQSRFRRLSTIVAGVNPGPVEIDTFGGVQNPLFGIVSYEFLRGLDLEETRYMVRQLGRRMGMHFTPEAIQYLQDRYGGHPLLTRLACSLTDTFMKRDQEKRPVTLDRPRMTREEERRDSDLVFYCRHVVSELQQFYPSEYALLELLASGQVKDFLEFSSFPEFKQHVEAYGLLAATSNATPTLSIPVLSRYIGLELARREGRTTVLKVIPKGDRAKWLPDRIEAILRDFRFLEQSISLGGRPSLFGPNSFPEADRFLKAPLAQDGDSLLLFLNACHRCFVESIENHGNQLKQPRYFWTTIKAAYPALYDALQRIRVYRVDSVHVLLKQPAGQELAECLAKDLEGRSPGQVPDWFFVLQQCVMDGLLTAIQIELNRLG